MEKLSSPISQQDDFTLSDLEQRKLGPPPEFNDLNNISDDDVKQILDRYQYGIGLIIEKTVCTDLVRDIKSTLKQRDDYTVYRIDRIVNRVSKDTVKAIMIPIGFITVPSLKRRTVISSIGAMRLKYNIEGYPVDVDQLEELPIVDLTAQNAFSMFMSYIRLYYPFYTLLNEVDDLTFIHGEDIEKIIVQRIKLGVKAHIYNTRNNSGFFYRDGKAIFDYDPAENVNINTPDVVNEIIKLSFKINHSYNKDKRDYPSAVLEMGSLFVLLTLIKFDGDHNQYIVNDLFGTQLAIPYYSKLLKRINNSVPYTSWKKFYHQSVKNFIRYETSYYFDDVIKDITDDNPMILPMAKFNTFERTPKQVDEALNRIIGGYLFDLDMSKTLITGSVICATISQLMRHNIDKDVKGRNRMWVLNQDYVLPEQFALIDILYPNCYTRLNDYDDKSYASLILAYRYLPDHITYQVADDYKSLKLTIPRLADHFFEEDDIDNFDGVNFDQEAKARIINNDPDFVYEFEIVPGVDVDMAIDVEDDQEFDAIVKNHYDVIRRYYNDLILAKMVRPNGRYIYEIRTTDYNNFAKGFRVVQLFRANRLTIAKFHLPMVRGWRDDTPGIKTTGTCTFSHLGASFHNMHFFQTSFDKLKIIAKYQLRGFRNRTSYSRLMNNIMDEKYRNGTNMRYKYPDIYGHKYLQFDYNIMNGLKYPGFNLIDELVIDNFMFGRTDFDDTIDDMDRRLNNLESTLIRRKNRLSPRERVPGRRIRRGSVGSVGSVSFGDSSYRSPSYSSSNIDEELAEEEEEENRLNYTRPLSLSEETSQEDDSGDEDDFDQLLSRLSIEPVNGASPSNPRRASPPADMVPVRRRIQSPQRESYSSSSRSSSSYESSRSPSPNRTPPRQTSSGRTVPSAPRRPVPVRRILPSRPTRRTPSSSSSDEEY